MLVVIIAVRKLLEYIFSMEELKALDDIIPESVKKIREEENQKDDETTGEGLLAKSGSSGKVTIALANGKLHFHSFYFFNFSFDLSFN